MDNLTHTLYGLALSQAGLNRVHPRATSAILIGANLPDIDMISLFWGPLKCLEYHRGFTHGIAGVICGASLLTAVVGGWHWKFSRQSNPGWWKLPLAALAGTGSHLLLDYTNSYGIRPFLPFSGAWYALDLVFIIDPWILLIFLLSLGLPFLLRLVSQEIGARSSAYSRGAMVCLLLIAGYWGVKQWSHRQAIQELDQAGFRTGAPMQVGAMPKIFNLLGWHGIVETSAAFHTVDVGWSPRSPLTSQRNRTYRKAVEDGVLKAALQSRTARIFSDFARFPVVTVEPIDEGYRVTIRDLRFDFATERRKRFLCTIELDQSLRVTSESFRF
ncbi:MAG: metal-dependent hydrolase [Acidobacteriota bacterium]